MVSQEKSLRVALLGQSGPFCGTALEVLQSCLPQAISLALIVEAPGHKRRQQSGFLWGLMQPTGRVEGERAWWDLNLAAKRLQVPYRWCHNGDDGAVMAACRKLHIDVGISVGLPFRLSSRMRAAAHEVLNVHPSMLPRWRGASPLFWWLRSGEASTGISVHVMRHAFDAGPVLAQRPFVPPKLASGESLLAAAGSASGRVLAQVLCGWMDGRRMGRPQEPGSFERAPTPRPEDGHIVPSAWTAQSLARFLAGAPFFRTPSMVLGGQRFFAADDAQAVTWQDQGQHQPLPGDFALVGSRLWMRARDGLVACRVQR